MGINPNDLSGTARLTFSEDFDALRIWDGTAGLDVTANLQAPLGSGNAGTRGYANNNEQQWYVNPGYKPADGAPGLPTPFGVSGGVLTITAAPSADAIKHLIDGQAYTSGVLSTYHAFSQTYGYFEMRAELPAGQGLWPAFWLMPADGSWPPEIDVMEMLGDKPGTVYTTVHSQVSGIETVGYRHLQTTSNAEVADTSKGFHTFGVDWEPDHITWYVDGRQVFQADTPADANKPMYMIANLAVGGNWPGQPDGTTTFPAEMRIDYLRAYDTKPVTEPAPPVPTSPPASQGKDLLVVHASQDVFGTDAAFVVMADGVQVGGVHSVHADHRAGAWDAVEVRGDFSKAAHVLLAFVNDANDGRGGDRNLYVRDVTLNGHAVSAASSILDQGVGAHEGDVAALWANGGASFNVSHIYQTPPVAVEPPPIVPPVAVDPAPPAEHPGPPPATNHALTIRVAQDAFGEDARFDVSVDGVRIGGEHVAHARQGVGWDEITLRGDFNPAGHVAVTFLNDANDGHGGDRNLYVGGVSIDGREVGPDHAVLDTGVGRIWPDAAALWSNGKAIFDLSPDTDHPAAPAPLDTLTLRVSQDAYGEDARFVVSVDGIAIGGEASAHAIHGRETPDSIELRGHFASADTVTVTFLNDANDGRGGDRNLHIDDLLLNGHSVGIQHVTLDPGIGMTGGDGTSLWSNGAAAFHLDDAHHMF